MYVFVVGMERCGTHSIANIVKHSCKTSCWVEHEAQPFLCKEAQLIYEEKDFRTEDLKKKLKFYRRQHKTHHLVCEANHRLGYFITLLMREFGPNCKFIFLFRDPIATIISRIGIWSHYPDFVDKYPDFYQKSIADLKPPFDFNQYRISPPKTYQDKSIPELYAWEWVENYKTVRNQLACVPAKNRFLMHTEDITPHFDKILGFIGIQYFDINDEIIYGWSKVKSDSIYVQPKNSESDVYVTRNRDSISDETVIFARKEVSSHKGAASALILSEMIKLHTDVDQDLIDMDKKIIRWLKIKMA